MAQPQILIVDSSSRRARALRDSMLEITLPTPHHRGDGESAVLWLGANHCDLCVISYELPGMDGLETLARMRTRHADLPAIVIADSQEQHVAIAAFRTGVIDFIPARGSFPRIVAERAQAFLEPANRSHQTMTQAFEDPSLRDVPPERLKPTYQNRLRTIGRQLDLYGYDTVGILEVSGGFVVRAHVNRTRRAETLEFADSEFPRLVGKAHQDSKQGGEKPVSTSTLIPTGYEDLLRALGFRLDQIAAESIIVAELDDVIAVGGRGNDETGSVPGIVPFQFLLHPPDVDFMLDEAFNRRGRQGRQERPPVQEPTGFRGILRRLN